MLRYLTCKWPQIPLLYFTTYILKTFPGKYLDLAAEGDGIHCPSSFRLVIMASLLGCYLSKAFGRSKELAKSLL